MATSLTSSTHQGNPISRTLETAEIQEMSGDAKTHSSPKLQISQLACFSELRKSRFGVTVLPKTKKAALKYPDPEGTPDPFPGPPKIKFSHRSHHPLAFSPCQHMLPRHAKTKKKGPEIYITRKHPRPVSRNSKNQVFTPQYLASIPLAIVPADSRNLFRLLDTHTDSQYVKNRPRFESHNGHGITQAAVNVTGVQWAAGIRGAHRDWDSFIPGSTTPPSSDILRADFDSRNKWPTSNDDDRRSAGRLANNLVICISIPCYLTQIPRAGWPRHAFELGKCTRALRALLAPPALGV
ncbi:hypothetical protein D9611_009116 [Ephemerocybe angulata]|uniref:Uncharacterized protein n=1 Tax=Ephemerocybe angulata TaxID=980116 RepID=A0A8H5FKA5_9AGAR|nr:hypothetical protein D9611_009116 [Tulosesus angulatus]